MGISSVQDYVENLPQYFKYFSNCLEDFEDKQNFQRVVVVHADSIIKHFYQEYSDWICGGQWSELYQNIERYVHAFRQVNIEPIIFMNGNLNDFAIHHWKLKHNLSREIVKEVLSHVQHNSTIPFRKRTKEFIYPASLMHAIRLAFRSYDVLVCSTLDDSFKEAILYSKDNNSLGIIGQAANFIFYNTTNYINLGTPTRWTKRLVPSCKIFDIELFIKDLGLKINHLPYLATLLGNFLIPDNWLSSFFWDLVEDDHPVKKLQSNLTLTAVLPPVETRIKCVANFINTHTELLEDIEKLADFVFGKSKDTTIEDGAILLAQAIDYYKDKLKASNSLQSSEKDLINNCSIAGYPLPILQEFPNILQNGKYKRCWEPPEKPRNSNSTSQLDESLHKLERQNSEKLDNPEAIIRQGTLEEAAEALEQLELNENANGLHMEEKETANITEEKTLHNEVVVEEKPQEKLEEEKLETEVKEDLKEKPEEKLEEKLQDKEKESQINEEEYDKEERDVLSEDYPRGITIESILPEMNADVLLIARRRHQNGQMCPEILQLLLKGEIILNMALDDEETTDRLQIPLLYRPLRQLMYGILFGAAKEVPQESTKPCEPKEEEQQQTGDDRNDEIEMNNNETDEQFDDNENETCDDENDTDSSFKVKEWCIHSNKSLDEPDLVPIKSMNWGVPPLKKLWFGMNSEDNANRLKAFLSCMKSDTVNMSNTAMVPHRLMLLCCVLRYLVQQSPRKAVLSKQDIDAFLAQALSPQLTMEENSQNLTNLKLSRVDSRCIQLASIFMKGIENAILANDACGSPVPWEFCCPWNFFNGKLFHSKWIQSSMNINTIDLCDGKAFLAEKLDRLRWCITEGLDSKYTVTGLQNSKKFYNPFSSPPQTSNGRISKRGIIGIGSPVSNGRTNRGRGSASRRPVSGNGGTLHVAGVPVAHWNGNKSGIGYSKNAPNVLVGGPASVDLPSDHRARMRAAKKFGRGRGLLETPYISPWQQGPGYEDLMHSTYVKYLKGVQKAQEVRSRLSKLGRGQLYTAGKSHNENYAQNNHRLGNKDSYYVGRGRSHQLNRNILSPTAPVYTHRSYGRGNWLSP